MKKVKLGNKGLEIPQIGLGCMGMTTWAGADVYGKSDESEAIATIHRSLELGGNFLDTADVYGPFENERLIAKAIKGKRDKFIIATKFGLEVNEAGTITGAVNGSPAYIRMSIERSLINLRTDIIDLYYLHRMDPKISIEDTVGEMANLVKEGKVRYIGLSEVSADTIKKAHAIHPLTALQTEYSLFEREVERNGTLNTLDELGIGLIAYSPLGRGFISGEIKSPADIPESDFRRYMPRFQGEQFYKNITLLKEINKIADEKEVTASQLALSWIIAKGITPIPGTKRIKYVEQNIDSTLINLTKDDIDRLEKIIPIDAETGLRMSEAGMKQVNL